MLASAVWHRLRESVARPLPRSKVIQRSQFQVLPVPEGGVIPRMVVIVTDSDVQGDTPEQLGPRQRCVLRVYTEHIENLRVRHITGIHLVGLGHCQTGYDMVPSTCPISVEPPNKKNILAERWTTLALGHVHAGHAREREHRGLGVDHRERSVIRRRELGEPLGSALVSQRRLRTCAPQARTVKQSHVQGRGELSAFIEDHGRTMQLIESGRLVPGRVALAIDLKVQGSEAVRTGAQHVVDLAQGVRCGTPSPFDDTATPPVRASVPQDTGDTPARPAALALRLATEALGRTG